MDFLYFFDNDFKMILPELFLFFGILLLLSYGCIYSTSRMYNFPIIQLNVGLLSTLCLFFTLLLLINSPLSSGVIFNNLLVIDAFSTTSKIFIVISSLICCIISMQYLEHKKVNSFEYFILILLATLGMLCLASVYDLLSLYLSVELVSLSFYVLAAYKRNSEFSGEAGLK